MLAYEIVIWAILGGIWMWLLLWDIRVLKANGRLRNQLHQLQEEIKQHQSKPSYANNTGQKPLPSPVEQMAGLEKSDNACSIS
jgi:hypothetical protein